MEFKALQQRQVLLLCNQFDVAHVSVAIAPHVGMTTPPVLTDAEYDFENRLVNCTLNDASGVPLVPLAKIGIVYDGDGNRVKKSVTNLLVSPNTVTETYYIVDDQNPTGYAQVIEEWLQAPGGQTQDRAYTYGPKLISQTFSSQPPETGVYWYGYDGHGSVRFLTDKDGQAVTAYGYDAFGNLISHSPVNFNELTPNNYLYAGEQFDPDLGLYYLRARYYNPQTGRFWSMDTYEGAPEDPPSLHKYLYCSNDPVNSIDPSGFSEDTRTLMVTQGIMMKLAPWMVPAALVVQRTAPTWARGLQHVRNIATTVVARGGELLVWEQQIQNRLGQNIDKFKLDLIIQRVNSAGQSVKTLIEGKGVLWYLHRSRGWNNYLEQLERQAEAFSRATHSAGVQIQERMIVFSTKIPPGLEKAAGEIQKKIAEYYKDGIFWGIQAFDDFLAK